MRTMLEGIPEAFGNRLRLAILAVLMEGECDFVTLRQRTGGSDGNLSTQLAHLEALRYLESSKEIVNRKTRTTYRLTDEAASAYRRFLTLMVSSLLRGKGTEKGE